MNLIDLLPTFLLAATLLPLGAFFVILIFGAQMPSRVSSSFSIVAIVGAAVLSFASLFAWVAHHPLQAAHHGEHAGGEHAGGEHKGGEHKGGEHAGGEHKGGEHKGGEHKGGEHKGGEHAGGEHKGGEHAGGEHKGGEHKGGEHKGGEHKGGEHKGGDHKGGDHKGEEHADREHAEGEHADGEHAEGEHADGEHAAGGHGPDRKQPKPLAGRYYLLGKAGGLSLEIGYYIDALTVCMFAMVTLIASCIHFYAKGYMHDEETEDYVDNEVETGPVHRPGRYHRFFQYLSLFCFSMLGLVLAGNIAMVFVFWELVGICSYFLIGFYVERHSASTAANKAFIVNRVGDFGMIIGLMALWSGLGTFNFGDTTHKDAEGHEHVRAGIFSLVRPAEHDHHLTTPDGMVQLAARDETGELVRSLGPDATDEQIAAAVAEATPAWREKKGLGGASYGYWLLIVAGAGIFCGCVGKSAQFPLHVWLPDAMEGPTPVSALVHSATMVAAGVYLVGRFFPVFTPEVLLVIAAAGCITLFLAATIAITATDIKRVLAYSTISQLGYMMLSLGLGGWLPGLMHLITHAFFKSLLFMCSGSVIHAVHTNEMTQMGGLRKKMPVTAYTMLVGCLAIAGAGVPFLIGFSGYYSKDKILEQAFSFMKANAGVGMLFFAAAAGGAAITSFYMFRLWYMTFAGKPRDPDRYDHAHESPKVMYVPLLILSALAIGVAWTSFEGYLVGSAGLVGTGVVAVWLAVRGRLSADAADAQPPAAGQASEGHEGHEGHEGDGRSGEHGGRHGPAGGLSPRAALVVSALAFGAILCFSYVWSQGPGGQVLISLEGLLEQARPAGTLATVSGQLTSLTWPSEELSHDASIVVPATILAFSTALGGFALATLMYGLGWLNPDEVRRQFQPVYRLLVNKWWFDELYDWMFVRPVHVLSRCFVWTDRRLLDGLLHLIAGVTRQVAVLWDRFVDRGIVDAAANRLAGLTKAAGGSLRSVQTGSLRQYVMFIVIGAVVIFLFISFFWNPVLAG